MKLNIKEKYEDYLWYIVFILVFGFFAAYFYAYIDNTVPDQISIIQPWSSKYFILFVSFSLIGLLLAILNIRRKPPK